MPKKVMFIFGTRPEAIKMVPVIIEFKKYPTLFETVVCVTGQHREMLDRVLSLFDIQPDIDLNIMKQGQDLYDITSSILIELRYILKLKKPEIVLVHGDTTTSMAAALAAFYQQIPVGHVEAGLRTHDIYSPWPEEINRQITGRIAAYHFAPTSLSSQNLLEEHIAQDRIFITGNTVIDALHMVVKKIKEDEILQKNLVDSIKLVGYDIDRLKQNKRLVLITGHRRENFGEGFMEICKSIKTLSDNFPDVDFVYPMHLNPNVRKPINDFFGETNNSNLFFIEPLDYFPFVYLMDKCFLILTDSGGIQEEAPGLSVPVLVMRNTTERPEGVEAGTVKLVGTVYKNIVDSVSLLLTNKDEYNLMSKSTNPYGDGRASERILKILSNV